MDDCQWQCNEKQDMQINMREIQKDHGGARGWHAAIFVEVN